jgi:hypothetical protein
MTRSAELKYHRRVFALVSEVPEISESATHEVDQFEKNTGQKLPLAIREWMTIDSDARLFHRITEFPHNFVRPSELERNLSVQNFAGNDIRALTIVFENQGCFVMAVDVAESDDPKVWVSRDFFFSAGEKPTWLLQSNRFSECMEAFAWDFAVISEVGTDGFRTYDERLEQELITETGPTTFNTAAWFHCGQFRRMKVNGTRLTLFV